jgi:hypothetical protein
MVDNHWKFADQKEGAGSLWSMGKPFRTECGFVIMTEEGVLDEMDKTLRGFRKYSRTSISGTSLGGI